MNAYMQTLANEISEDFENSKKNNRRKDGVYKLPIELLEFFVIKNDLQKKIRLVEVEKYLIENGFSKRVAKFSGNKMKRCWAKSFRNSDGVWL